MAVLVEFGERRPELAARLKPLRRIRFDTACDDLIERFGNRGIDRPHACRSLAHPVHEIGERGLFGGHRRAPAHKHFGQHHAERVHVGALVGRFALRLLRRHVRQRADDAARNRGAGAVGRPRDAEIHDQRLIVIVDHDVRGFEIAVHDAGLVCGDQPVDDVPRVGQRAGHREVTRLTEHRRQIRAVHVRHRDVLDAVHVAEIVNAHDVLVRHLSREEELALETPLERGRRLGIACDVGTDHFQRDGNAELGIPRVVHRAHSADAEQTDDGIARPDHLPGGEQPGRSRRWKPGDSCRRRYGGTV